MSQYVYISKTLFSPLAQETGESRRIREQQLSAEGRNLVKQLLMEIWNLDPLDQEFGIGAHGKPYLIKRPDLHFNISHSGNLVIAAVSDAPVGIDIERIRLRGRMDPAKLAARSFPTSYLIRMGQAEDPKEEFFHLWTELEAYGKYLGSGLAGAIRTEPAEGIGMRIRVPEGYAGCLWTREQAVIRERGIDENGIDKSCI